ncbi:hypothetical protein ACMA1D_02925 [Streptomyces sp. 796.1]|uniref:hypothetical protein n=1 Tax=Streptomyces sp. 796.1 TaxID=3163029 RepID=UPI0039C9985D
MEAVVAILGLVFLLCIAAGVYAAVKVAKAAKRGVDRTVSQARRTVEDTKLRAKQYTQLGPVAEIAELRISLRTSMRATRQALDTAAAEDGSLTESLALFERLSTHGHEVDDDLRRLESEPDRTRIATRLPELRKRTERVTQSADSLRWAIQDRAGHFAEDELGDLSEQIRMEAAALRHWRSEPDTGAAGGMGRDGGAGGAGGGRPVADDWGAEEAGAAGGAGPTSGVRAAGAAGSRPAASGPGRSGAHEADAADDGSDPPAPRALTGDDPRLRKTYPWQRTARPENTT